MWITLKNYKRCVTQYEYDYRPACKYCGSKSICMCEDYQVTYFNTKDVKEIKKKHKR